MLMADKVGRPLTWDEYKRLLQMTVIVRISDAASKQIDDLFGDDLYTNICVYLLHVPRLPDGSEGTPELYEIFVLNNNFGGRLQSAHRKNKFIGDLHQDVFEPIYKDGLHTLACPPFVESDDNGLIADMPDQRSFSSIYGFDKFIKGGYLNGESKLCVRMIHGLFSLDSSHEFDIQNPRIDFSKPEHKLELTIDTKNIKDECHTNSTMVLTGIYNDERGTIRSIKLSTTR